MNLRHLEVLRAVVRCGGVSDAARLLGVSQPAVSKALRECQEELGVQLFERRAGRLSLRPEAKPLVDTVERIFFDVERVRLLAQEIREPTTSRLRIGAIPTMTMTVLPPAIAEFRRRFPDARLEIHALPTREIVDGVAIGTLDLGIAYEARDHPALEMIPLGDAEVLCAMRRDHPLARKAAVSPTDLEQVPLVSFHLGEPISLTIIEGFRAAGARFAPQMLVSHSYIACALAERGAGVALVGPFLVASGTFRELVTRPFRPVLHLSPRIFHGRERRPTLAAAAMIDEVRLVVARQIAGRP
ncbi:MAG: LysR family transcriptional regulator [Alphaproteobacteria bacterium]|nr:LysR family transcriptional regulator [Alphaproteobacteria bacterium]